MSILSIKSKIKNRDFPLTSLVRITYIYLGSNDTILQYGFKPEEKPYLVKVWDQGGVLIYRVKWSGIHEDIQTEQKIKE